MDGQALPPNVLPFRSIPAPPAPYNPEAEQALLGALLIENSRYYRISEYLRPEHFGNAMHGRIYEAIGKLIGRGQIANPVTMKAMFDQDAALADIGGSQYLARLAAEGAPLVNADDYGRLVQDLHLRRELIAVGQDMVNDAYKQGLDDPAPRQIERSETKLFDLATSGQIEGGLRTFGSALNGAINDASAAYQRDGRTVGVSTGFTDLDVRLGGLYKTDLVVLAGRPSMGKTALATNIAFNAALAFRPGPSREAPPEDGAMVAYFSLEMSAEQLATRILAEQTGIGSEMIRRGRITNQDFDRFVGVSRRLAELPLFIDDSPALTVASVRSRARRLMRTKGLGLIVIDYLQLMSAPDGQRHENRVQEVSALSRGLKNLAKELRVPVLALSQLSRKVEDRDDKRPQLADLRESGTIEQDADAVMFIYREEYYLQSRQPDPSDLDKWSAWRTKLDQAAGKAQVILGKNRHGPTGAVDLRFNATTTRFENLWRGGPDTEAGSASEF